MNIPTRNECYGLMVEMKMLENIAIHSITVARVALTLTEYINASGIELRLDLVQAAALLHDITKTRSFLTKENHAESGGFYLVEKGYPQVADIVRQHVCLDSEPALFPPTEVSVVNYADKRVLHDHIVPLKKRMRYILERYGRNPAIRKRISALTNDTVLQEASLFSPLPINPEELSLLIDPIKLSEEIKQFQRVYRA